MIDSFICSFYCSEDFINQQLNQYIGPDKVVCCCLLANDCFIEDRIIKLYGSFNYHFFKSSSLFIGCFNSIMKKLLNNITFTFRRFTEDMEVYKVLIKVLIINQKGTDPCFMFVEKYLSIFFYYLPILIIKKQH